MLFLTTLEWKGTRDAGCDGFPRGNYSSHDFHFEFLFRKTNSDKGVVSFMNRCVFICTTMLTHESLKIDLMETPESKAEILEHRIEI